MKKNKIKIISLLIFVFLISSFLTKNVNAEVTVWSYKETATFIEHGDFESQPKCEEHRTSTFTVSGVVITQTTPCQPKQISGLPIVPPQDPVTEITPINTSAVENKSVYNFLAPIGKIRCMDSKASSDGPTIDSNGCIPNNIGYYLNFIFKLGIGISAALAVLMLIMGGIMYMGDESVFGKTEAKHKMKFAILGLLISLGAWALLFTINPDLTGQDADGNAKQLNINSANIDVEREPLTQNSPYVEGQRTNGCPGGIVTASTEGVNISVCNTLKNKVESMIRAAKAAGINLSGYGYRSTSEQERLRAQNCGGSANINNPKASCNPPTALPGTSNHENGLAIDFKCDGAQIRARDNKCFVWLKNNAGAYGYKNLDSEPWHWSINGH